jgi:hypothetical protein
MSIKETFMGSECMLWSSASVKNCDSDDRMTMMGISIAENLSQNYCQLNECESLPDRIDQPTTLVTTPK